MPQKDYVRDFIYEVKALHKQGDATEHSFRPALQKLLESVRTNITVINEPRAADYGTPDFKIVTKNTNLPIGHLEAKNLGADIRQPKGTNKEQQERYLKGSVNIAYTNCCDWHFYRNKKLVHSVSIADFKRDIKPDPTKFDSLRTCLTGFLQEKPLPINSADDLAERMADVAKQVKLVLANVLKLDSERRAGLHGQYDALKKRLALDITPEEFADIYAETIAYGMFAARLHDKTPDDFSRHEALDLVPKSNPFLRNLFSYIAGPNCEEAIKLIIDDLADIFAACNVRELLSGYGPLTGRDDPFIHFYENFLAAYNPQKRKARGVWYTPIAVVDFIIRAVDDVLQKEFGLANGIADISKTTVQGEEFHKVQILDPAAGTGTFLAEIIKQIKPKIKKTGTAAWHDYVENHLIPRLHGFELLMASYAMCHIKLDLVLQEFGYQPPTEPPRLNVYLTNSLEKSMAGGYELDFEKWLSDEAKGANEIKDKKPIMCVIGNPPYSGISQNMGQWITEKIEDYKYVDGVHFGERKHWLQDDYVKFLRFAEYMIDKNGEGILGFITNHGYLDNPTFRGMRWHLLKTFDKIYVLDLHGNALKKEVAPDGTADKNVFDIRQGVAIIIAIKKTKQAKTELAELYHAELWGAREHKYAALNKKTLASKDWQKLSPRTPQYLFIPYNYELEEKYKESFSINDFFEVGGTAIVTKRDKLTIQKNKKDMWQAVQDMLAMPEAEVREKYKIPADVRDWKFAWAVADLKENYGKNYIQPISYRPFDTRFTYYTGNTRGFIGQPVKQVMRHMLAGENIGLLVSRSATGERHWKEVQCTNQIAEFGIMSTRPGNGTPLFPLYLYDEMDGSKRVNFDSDIYKKLQNAAKHKKHGTPDEMAVFDYIYGVLHCPAYRDTYKEFLKADFPRIPYPSTPAQFWRLAEKGGQLRRLHLMQPEAIGNTPYEFTDSTIGKRGDSIITKPHHEGGKVWINDEQYFDKVPASAWEAYIGGYQPAQKWLKDRKNRKLSFDDITHYQKIIKILVETERIMRTIKMDL